MLLVSLMLRNPLVLHNGDSLMSATLFWGMFLPWGERYSLDEKSTAKDRNDTVFSLATFAMLIQLALLYGMAGVVKTIQRSSAGRY